MIPWDPVVGWFLRISIIVVLARCAERFVADAAMRYAMWKLALVIVALVPFVSDLIPFSLGSVHGVTPWSNVKPLTDISTGLSMSVAYADGPPEISLWEVVWLIGFVVAAGRMAWSTFGLVRWTREGRAAGPEWDGLAADIGSAVGYSRPVSIFFHWRVGVPGAWQWGRPIILLPPEAERWSRREKSLTLRHEMIHLHNRDTHVQLFSLFLRAVWWWHPMMYWMHKRLMLSCEMSCDALVVSFQKDRTAYAQWLLDVGRRAVRTVSVMMLMARQSSLGERVTALLHDPYARRLLTRRSRYVLSVMLLLFTGAASLSVSFHAAVSVAKKPSVGSFAYQSIEETIRAGRSDDPYRRSLAAWSLRQFDETAALEALGRLSQDADAVVRENALYSIGESKNARAIAYVRNALHDPVPSVRIAALGAAASYPELASHVEPLLKDSDRDVRLVALCIWVGLNGENSGPVLLAAAASHDETFRMKAAELLGPFPQPTFVRTLIHLLDDPSEYVRNQAALAVGQYRHAEAQTALVRLLRDPSQTVRSTAAWALKQF